MAPSVYCDFKIQRHSKTVRFRFSGAPVPLKRYGKLHSMKAEEKNLIQAFAKHLGFSVEEWPEETSPKPRQIDAIAGPWAIEHTSVDMIEGDRTLYERFNRIRSLIERKLSPDITFPLTIWLDYPAIANVKDQRVEARVAEAVVRRVEIELTSLKDGVVTDFAPSDELPRFKLLKNRRQRSEVHVGTFTENVLPNLLPQFQDKLAKLRDCSYDKKRLLLIETHNIQHDEPEVILGELAKLFCDSNQWKPDAVWRADTSIGGHDPEFSNESPALGIT
jgi:hypothetical protein